MAGWGSAFATAFKIVIMSIVWIIVGLVLVFIGLSMVGMPFYPGPTTHVPRIGLTGTGLIGIIIMIIGYAILFLGTLASFLKYSAEYYAEEIREKGLMYTQRPPY